MSKAAYRAHVSHYSSVVLADVTVPCWLIVCSSIHRVWTIFRVTYGVRLQNNRGNKTIH